MNYPDSIQRLIDAFSQLPGVGPRTATRYAFHLLRHPKSETESLIQALQNLSAQTQICRNCFNVSEKELCRFCADKKRDRTIICVVEEATDIPVIENTGNFRGLYHVLGGTINPAVGIGPNELRIAQLLTRIKKSEVQEIIIATSPTLEGDTTGSFLVKTLKPHGLRITQLARGLSTGSNLEYADEMTVLHALQERKEF